MPWTRPAVPVEFSKGEWGPGQHEINLRFAPALEMADRHVVYKQARQGDRAAAAAARSPSWPSSITAWRAARCTCTRACGASDGTPAFGEPGPPLAGTPGRGARAVPLLARRAARARARDRAAARADRELVQALPGGHLRADRASPGATTTAPRASAWWGSGASLRVECRIPGADANPYLAYAALIAAGLDGIERRIEPGPAFQGDVYRAAELPRIPRTLPEAIRAFEQSRFVRDAFGDDVVGPPAPLRAHRAGERSSTWSRTSSAAATSSASER